MHVEISGKEKINSFLAGIFVGLLLLAVVLYQIPAVQDRFSWRIDFAMAYARGLIDPVRPMPTPDVSAVGAAEVILPEPTTASTPTPAPSLTAEGLMATAQPSAATPTITQTPLPTLTPTQIPGSARLTPPKWEKQEVNNCGPATLSMFMHFYNWEGDQSTISDSIKPKREDRNVNVEELVSYVNTESPGLEIQYRVGGDIDTLKRLIAAGYPVMIEEAFLMAESYWMNDDRWSGHYLLLTGYDDELKTFTVQDAFVGANQKLPYQAIDEPWRFFNRVYIMLYPPEDRPIIQSILGDQWDANTNREHALALAQKEIDADPTDSYAWFNLGTNLVYFEKYSQAAKAYDEARKAGLPQRMLRYQFGPFFAYFHTGRNDDLIALTEYALKITPNSEEAMLWQGWALYRKGNRDEAVKLFQQALEARPEYSDANYALKFVQTH